MSFSGLNHWVESDSATKLRQEILGDLLKHTIRALNETTHGYDTPGFINIALMVESGVYSFMDSHEFDDVWEQTFSDVVAGIDDMARKNDRSELLRLRRSVLDFVGEMTN